jgi:hypothetical protein
MAMQLSTELANALDQQGNVPLPTVHPGTGKVFFLVSEQQYSRLKSLFENEPLSLQEQRHQLEELGRRAGWDDPAMDAYDRYDDQQSKAKS